MADEKRDSVTILVCTKNEAGGIGQIVEQVRAYADEVLVVDGHSADDTRAIAEDRMGRPIQTCCPVNGAGHKRHTPADSDCQQELADAKELYD